MLASSEWNRPVTFLPCRPGGERSVVLNYIHNSFLLPGLSIYVFSSGLFLFPLLCDKGEPWGVQTEQHQYSTGVIFILIVTAGTDGRRDFHPAKNDRVGQGLAGLIGPSVLGGSWPAEGKEAQGKIRKLYFHGGRWIPFFHSPTFVFFFFFFSFSGDGGDPWSPRLPLPHRALTIRLIKVYSVDQWVINWAQ